jgi:acetyltransferase-like isoleucine patch superfamily enzyme
LSSSINFRPSDAHKIYDRTSGERINPPEPIIIGNRVWIGENVQILKGTVIPDGCVISSMSRVSGVFTEPNCIIGGSPARVIRQNIDWEP